MTTTKALRAIRALELTKDCAKAGSWYLINDCMNAGLYPGKKYLRTASGSIFVRRWINSHSQSEVLEMIDRAMTLAQGD